MSERWRRLKWALDCLPSCRTHTNPSSTSLLLYSRTFDVNITVPAASAAQT